MRAMRRGRRTMWALAVVALFSATALPASAAVVPAGFAYVALGDSYTAGPGIPFQIPEAAACRRSNHNYPHLVADVLEVSEFTDVSCSGATTVEMTEPQQSPSGGTINAPQLDALDDDVDLVTLGIGGNDIGFGEISRTCGVLGLFAPFGAPCQQRFTQAGVDPVATIDAIAPELAAVLVEIHDRAPDAAVLLVGYPVILPDQGTGCWPLVPLASGDVVWLRDVQRRLNAMLAGVAAAGGATFVDTYANSIGHDVCALPGVKWVEGFIPTAPAARFHPNFLGMLHDAREVLVRVAAPLPS